MRIFLLTLLGAAISVLLDWVWFSLFGAAYYARHLPGLLRMQSGAIRPQILPAVAAYLFLSLGITMFVLPRVGTLLQAAAFGALYGLVVFGVYEATNMAILQGWSWRVVVVDILWGCLGGAVLSCILFSVSSMS